MKTRNFFGDNGITSTSANHIANMAKEATRAWLERLAATRFYTETVGLLTSDSKAVVRYGMNSDSLNGLGEVVRKIAECNSLIAYLREAIKEKDKRLKEAQEYSSADILHDLYLKHNSIVRPDSPDSVTADDIMLEWSVGEQEKFLSLGAEASALGKFIHEDGYLNIARTDLMNKVENPSRIDLNGSETVVHTFIPTVTVNEVTALFNSLQAKYRAIQAELNGMKKKLEDEVLNRNLELRNEYNAKMREYNREVNAVNQEIEQVKREDDVRRGELLKEVQALKIVIPHRLKGIYDVLNGQK